MKKVMQTEFDDNGNCFEACVASILELDISEVPSVSDEFAWFQIMDKFVSKYGYGLLLLSKHDISQSEVWYEKAYVIVSGQSPRVEGRLHSVVWQNGKMIHDPHPDGIGFKGEPEDYIIFVALNAKADKSTTTLYEFEASDDNEYIFSADVKQKNGVDENGNSKT